MKGKNKLMIRKSPIQVWLFRMFCSVNRRNTEFIYKIQGHSKFFSLRRGECCRLIMETEKLGAILGVLAYP